MNIKFSSKCQKKLAKLKKRDKFLFIKLEKQLSLFCETPNHPSLRLHKLSGEMAGNWSISVDMSYRLLFYYYQDNKEKIAVFFNVGKHEEVYT